MFSLPRSKRDCKRKCGNFFLNRHFKDITNIAWLSFHSSLSRLLAATASTFGEWWMWGLSQKNHKSLFLFLPSFSFSFFAHWSGRSFSQPSLPYRRENSSMPIFPFFFLFANILPTRKSSPATIFKDVICQTKFICRGVFDAAKSSCVIYFIFIYFLTDPDFFFFCELVPLRKKFGFPFAFIIISGLR